MPCYLPPVPTPPPADIAVLVSVPTAAHEVSAALTPTALPPGLVATASNAAPVLATSEAPTRLQFSAPESWTKGESLRMPSQESFAEAKRKLHDLQKANQQIVARAERLLPRNAERKQQQNEQAADRRAERKQKSV